MTIDYKKKCLRLFKYFSTLNPRGVMLIFLLNFSFSSLTKLLVLSWYTSYWGRLTRPLLYFPTDNNIIQCFDPILNMLMILHKNSLTYFILYGVCSYTIMVRLIRKIVSTG
jgi:hypothetical protein